MSRRDSRPPKPRAEAPRFGVARALSKLGHCSRAQAERLVRAGRVTVNGRRIEDPEHPTRAGDAIAVDGLAVVTAMPVYLMLNKPRGLVTSAADERGRATVVDCLPQELRGRVGPVGRLDRASEGLLLFTNDTAWAARITDPRSRLAKTYHVQIDRVPDAALCRALVDGVEDAGERLAAADCRVLRAGARGGWLEIVLTGGRNRQIRRMLAAFGLETRRLMRVAIGPLALGTLAKGEMRPLTDEERDALVPPQ